MRLELEWRLRLNMQPYNVEIFDRSFNLVQHYNIENTDYKFDYLSIQENVILVPFNSLVQKGDYVRLKNDVHEFVGYISSLSVDESVEGYTNIGFRPLMGLFDTDIMVTVASQGVGYLETFIENRIKDYFINNADSSQNIYGLSVESISSTSGWNFYITEETEGTGKAIVSFMSIIQAALTKYSVVLFIDVDFQNKQIKCKIGNKNIASFTIEADLPSVISRSVIVNENKSDVNKLIIYDKSNLSSVITYYLHSDGTYDTTNTDRVTPVIYDMISVSVSTGQTFAQAAAEAANKQFGNNKKSNLIEITILNDDNLANPKSLEIGQLVTVITNGASYGSVLTGYEISDVTKLTFGTIRLDLTKILKEAMK